EHFVAGSRCGQDAQGPDPPRGRPAPRIDPFEEDHGRRPADEVDRPCARRRAGARPLERVDAEVEEDDIRQEQRRETLHILTRRRAPRDLDIRTAAEPPVQSGLDLWAHDSEEARHRPSRPARRRKAMTAALGMASASPPWTMALSPITRPRSSARGPPELPGA